MRRKKNSFNDNMLASVGIPLILLWLVFACYIIYSGINDETGFIQSNLDFYVALIAIIGGPALLFITAVLDAWKTESNAELQALPDSIAADLDAAKGAREHARALELAQLKHDHEMSALKQAHDLRVEEHSCGMHSEE